jgi:OOP family OmpA-OmpF porin
MHMQLSKYSFLGLIILSFSASAQNTVAKTSVPMATVNVVVTDTKKLPLKGEEVLFIAGTKKLSGRTDASGKFSLTLPSGTVYSIKLKTITDTSDYSSLEIPSLQPGQYFKGPFTINIEYEPARSFTLDNVHFDTGKPTLRPDSFKELNEIAEYMKWKEEERYEIAGHTDNVGKEEDNQRLSQQRAETVRNYLVKKGIPPGRLNAKGYGATQPVADNETPEGRQKNRRTELVIL